MKETSQRYLNSEAHGYLMEAKACKLLLKDLERIRAKLRRHIEKEAADREAEFEAAMQYHSESDIQEAYGWEFISERQYERYLEVPSLASSLRCSLAFFCSMPPSASEAWYPATKF